MSGDEGGIIINQQDQLKLCDVHLNKNRASVVSTVTNPVCLLVCLVQRRRQMYTMMLITCLWKIKPVLRRLPSWTNSKLARAPSSYWWKGDIKHLKPINWFIIDFHVLHFSSVDWSICLSYCVKFLQRFDLLFWNCNMEKVKGQELNMDGDNIYSILQKPLLKGTYSNAFGD